MLTHRTPACLTLLDFLYANKDAKDLNRTFDDLKWYDTLLSWRSNQWSDLITRYVCADRCPNKSVRGCSVTLTLYLWLRMLVNNPSIVVIGKPSAALADKITKEQADLLEATKARLGPEGLEAKAVELAQAQKENDREIPEKMITDFPISDAAKIDWIPVESGVNTVDGSATKSGKVQAHLDQDGDKLPYFVHYSHVQSNFINIRAIIDTTKLSPDLMP